MTQIFKNPNLPTALAFRERFPTPAVLAAVPLSVLQSARGKSHYYSDAKLQELQQLALQTIGTKDQIRQRGLLLEQTQLIRELRILQEHIEELESEMRTIVEHTREGQILCSMFIGPIQAATIIAAIGSIENFPNAASLKSYFGWAPTREQTGTSYDKSRLTQGGTRTMRQMMFLIVCSVIQQKNEWAHLYERLVLSKCPYEERTGVRTGKLRVIGRVAGQMIETMYALLKTDAETLSKVPKGQEPPPPVLYDSTLHQSHREGHYRPLKPSQEPARITLLPHLHE